MLWMRNMRHVSNMRVSDLQYVKTESFYGYGTIISFAKYNLVTRRHGNTFFYRLFHNFNSSQTNMKVKCRLLMS